MANQLFYGSISLTELIEQAKVKHSAFTKAQNGKIYVNINIWLNEEEDKFGNIMSVQLNPSKERKDKDAKVYIGNLKKSDGAKPLGDNDISNVEKSLQEAADDLPF